MCSAKRHIRFIPESGHWQCTSPCLLLWARSRHWPKGQLPPSQKYKRIIRQAVPKEQKFLWLNRSSEETRYHMFIRQLTAASLVAFALISLPGSTRTATAQALKYCKEDVARLCPGVAPGGGKIIGCLKQHENEVSIGCGKELKAIKAKMGK